MAASPVLPRRLVVRGPETCFIHKPEPYEFTDEQIDHFFAPFATIRAVQEVGIGYFVELSSAEEVEIAVEQLDQKGLGPGWTMRVDKLKPEQWEVPPTAAINGQRSHEASRRSREPDPSQQRYREPSPQRYREQSPSAQRYREQSPRAHRSRTEVPEQSRRREPEERSYRESADRDRRSYSQRATDRRRSPSPLVPAPRRDRESDEMPRGDRWKPLAKPTRRSTDEAGPSKSTWGMPAARQEAETSSWALPKQEKDTAGWGRARKEEASSSSWAEPRREPPEARRESSEARREPSGSRREVFESRREVSGSRREGSPPRERRASVAPRRPTPPPRAPSPLPARRGSDRAQDRGWPARQADVPRSSRDAREQSPNRRDSSSSTRPRDDRASYSRTGESRGPDARSSELRASESRSERRASDLGPRNGASSSSSSSVVPSGQVRSPQPRAHSPPRFPRAMEDRAQGWHEQRAPVPSRPNGFRESAAPYVQPSRREEELRRKTAMTTNNKPRTREELAEIATRSLFIYELPAAVTPEELVQWLQKVHHSTPEIIITASAEELEAQTVWENDKERRIVKAKLERIAKNQFQGDEVEVLLERRSGMQDLADKMGQSGLEGAVPDMQPPDDEEALSPNDDYLLEFGFSKTKKEDPKREGTPNIGNLLKQKDKGKGKESNKENESAGEEEEVPPIGEYPDGPMDVDVGGFANQDGWNPSADAERVPSPEPPASPGRIVSPQAVRAVEPEPQPEQLEQKPNVALLEERAEAQVEQQQQQQQQQVEQERLEAVVKPEPRDEFRGVRVKSEASPPRYDCSTGRVIEPSVEDEPAPPAQDEQQQRQNGALPDPHNDPGAPDVQPPQQQEHQQQQIDYAAVRVKPEPEEEPAPEVAEAEAAAFQEAAEAGNEAMQEDSAMSAVKDEQHSEYDMLDGDDAPRDGDASAAAQAPQLVPESHEDAAMDNAQVGLEAAPVEGEAAAVAANSAPVQPEPEAVEEKPRVAEDVEMAHAVAGGEAEPAPVAERKGSDEAEDTSDMDIDMDVDDESGRELPSPPQASDVVMGSHAEAGEVAQLQTAVAEAAPPGDTAMAHPAKPVPAQPFPAEQVMGPPPPPPPSEPIAAAPGPPPPRPPPIVIPAPLPFHVAQPQLQSPQLQSPQLQSPQPQSPIVPLQQGHQNGAQLPAKPVSASAGLSLRSQYDEVKRQKLAKMTPEQREQYHLQQAQQQQLKQQQLQQQKLQQQQQQQPQQPQHHYTGNLSNAQAGSSSHAVQHQPYQGQPAHYAARPAQPTAQPMAPPRSPQDVIPRRQTAPIYAQVQGGNASWQRQPPNATGNLPRPLGYARTAAGPVASGSRPGPPQLMEPLSVTRHRQQEEQARQQQQEHAAQQAKLAREQPRKVRAAPGPPPKSILKPRRPEGEEEAAAEARALQPVGEKEPKVKFVDVLATKHNPYPDGKVPPFDWA